MSMASKVVRLRNLTTHSSVVKLSTFNSNLIHTQTRLFQLVNERAATNKTQILTQLANIPTVRTFARQTKATEEDDIEESPEVRKAKIDQESEISNLSTYRISQETKKLLELKKIDRLFPIQYETFDLVYDGKDVIGRARTGTGKTLAFALPIIEKLKQSKAQAPAGGTPFVLVMAPTRELARQITTEFEYLSQGKLRITTIYGGVSYQPQEMDLRRGVEIVIGTPGRIIDMMDRGSLKLHKVSHIVLDEADEMLKVGFQDAIDNIFQSVPGKNTRQVVLFSATIPDWVKSLADRYLKEDFEVVDLIGDEEVKSSVSIKHHAIFCKNEQMLQALSDVIRVHSGGGNTLVFARTKIQATEIATTSSIAPICQALHGDISQDQREVTMDAFRKGKFSVLVATDVAARGLDIPKIDLVINLEPPEVKDTYIHRVGRTGRAGKTGTAITFYDRSTEYRLRNLEREVGIKIDRFGTPQLTDVIDSASKHGIEQMLKVDPEMVEAFKPFALEALKTAEGSTLVAAALAHISGYSKKFEQRSLLTSRTGYVAVHIVGTHRFENARVVERTLMDYVSDFGPTKICLDGSAIVDIAEAEVQNFLQLGNYTKGFLHFTSVTQPRVLPAMNEPHGMPLRDRRMRDVYGSSEGGPRPFGNRGSSFSFNARRDNDRGVGGGFRERGGGGFKGYRGGDRGSRGDDRKSFGRKENGNKGNDLFDDDV